MSLVRVKEAAVAGKKKGEGEKKKKQATKNGRKVEQH